ncbi:GIY-YIG nuclease family protein [Alphaproteobacteria bacterium]|nr:GIY-YIG nuclease family protein [Alphaproteobacteria bacterium]
MKQAAIYIVTNKKNGTLYTVVTSDLPKRIYGHKNKIFDGFSKRYGCKTLVYYEVFDDMENAILREKQIKAGSRKGKISLIESMNPDWFDLYDRLV